MDEKCELAGGEREDARDRLLVAMAGCLLHQLDGLSRAGASDVSATAQAVVNAREDLLEAAPHLRGDAGERQPPEAKPDKTFGAAAERMLEPRYTYHPELDERHVDCIPRRTR